jgi:hypothetical protein
MSNEKYFSPRPGDTKRYEFAEQFRIADDEPTNLPQTLSGGSAFGSPRSLNRCTFPVAVFGSSGRNSTQCGRL